MLKKLKQIWHEIIERWFLSTFYAERMERERLQLIAQLIERKKTLWKNIPVGNPRTLVEILTYKPNKNKITTEVKEERDISEILKDALIKAKEKQNGNDKKTTNTKEESSSN